MKDVDYRAALPPRLIRFRDALRYLGMDRSRFNAEVRSSLTEIRIGVQGVAFDRLELDAWVDHRTQEDADEQGVAAGKESGGSAAGPGP